MRAQNDAVKPFNVGQIEEGKRMFNEIESCSSATDEVRQLSFRDKITAKAAEGAT